jgi:hypothetical protein
MLEEYVPIVSAVLVLCCSKCFMLQVASVLSRYCICFTHMFQVYVSNVLSVQTMLHSTVLYFRGVFRESLGHGPGMVSRVPVIGMCGAPGSS